MMRSQGTSRFSYNIRMRNIIFITNINKCADRVIYIFLNGIIYAALAIGRTGSIVIHSKTAPDINKFHIETQTPQLYIKLGCFTQGNFYTADFRDLAADMKMDKLYTISQFVFLNEIYGLQ